MLCFSDMKQGKVGIADGGRERETKMRAVRAEGGKNQWREKSEEEREKEERGREKRKGGRKEQTNEKQSWRSAQLEL